MTSPNYQDKEIQCECGEYFVWTKGEQKFMNRLLQQGKVKKVTEPKRCKECRIKKRAKFDNN